VTNDLREISVSTSSGRNPTNTIEAVIAGVPGMAVSTEAQSPADFETTARAAARVVEALARYGLPANTLLNVNVPPAPIQGVRVTRQGLRVYRDELVERRDPRGRPYYWIGGEMPTGVMEEGTDFWAVEHGYLSITPLQLDLTAYEALPALEQWQIELPG